MLAVMAIFKAGGAYLPLDCDYPKERLQYMLEDAEAKVLITTDFLEQIDFNSDCLPVDRDGLLICFDSLIPTGVPSMQASALTLRCLT